MKKVNAGKSWLAVLARAVRAKLEQAVAALSPRPEWRVVKQAESGLAMVRGRAGGGSTGGRGAWVEYVLAQGGAAEGLATLEAARDGGNFAAYRRAFTKLGIADGKRPSPAGQRRRSLAIANV